MQDSADIIEVASDSLKVRTACGIPPKAMVDESPLVTVAPPKPEAGRDHAVVAASNALWPNGTTITYSYFGGTEKQKNAVEVTAIEWTYYANITLERKDDNDRTAMVRIAFGKGGGNWSSTGRRTLKVPNDPYTMNLDGIDDAVAVSDSDRGIILHEWGHALGLLHEHQSPARGGSLTLNEEAVYDYYRHGQAKWDDDLIESQIIKVYKKAAVSNYCKLDTNSIMMYAILHSPSCMP
ncbi:hypothetical protein FPV67DRAFT_1448755 [Lyophyllum atratum]|nr:hypothetical protein FPV67DRAFT_1448755 [Lyophyllum atratum]